METADAVDGRVDEQPDGAPAPAPSEGAEPAAEDQKEAGPAKPAPPPRRRAAAKRAQRGKRRGPAEKRRGQKPKRRGPEEKREGVTVKTAWSGGKRRWDKKHYCVFCRRPQVKIARHMLGKHADEQEVIAASVLPPGSKQRQLLLEHLRCRGNYLHNIEVIRQGSGEIIPSRQPSEEVDARNYLPCPLCLGFFLRADLWKHQVSCRRKLGVDRAAGEAADAGGASDDGAAGEGSTAGEGSAVGEASAAGETSAAEPAGGEPPPEPEPGADRSAASEGGTDRPRKRARVQAAASRLLPISSGASESCSEILHRMNLDNVSYQVKSDWLICKYGNKLMGTQDGGQKRYDYVSQKLRELGRLLLAAKSLDPGVQTLQDLLAPGRLSLALSAARKASGYRWSRPPLAVKTTLKTVCEVAIGENLQDGDWEAAAKTTDFYHMLGREWDNLGLQNPGPDRGDPDGREKPKKRAIQLRTDKDFRPEGLSKSHRPLPALVPPDSRLQTPVSVPMAPKKVQRRPWSTAEKEAIWRQLGVHVLVQTVPGKEVCQRCLDLEPVLRGRHWKDIKNQVHNQIQSQKKQQFYVQMDQEETQLQPDQNQNQSQSQDQNHNQSKKKQPQQRQVQMDPQDKDPTQNQKKAQYQPPPMDRQEPDPTQSQKRQHYEVQLSLQNQKKQLDPGHQGHQGPLDHQDHQNHQNHLHMHKKQLCHARLVQQDQQDQQVQQVHRKQLYQMDSPSLQTLDRDPSLLTPSPFGPDGSHRAPGHPLLEREPALGPYPVLHRAPGPHMDPLLSRPDWPEDHLTQNYHLGRQLGRGLVPDLSSGGPPPAPHPGHVHF
ncbi:uncharacterized protein LOC115408849 [Salarias fasciatus]|uniref:uncharacterized protein LOC115408849 n=1 Tax=Salarias fasciatus TaxID=181472 RepID=UPI0011766FC8|nr:uncharacterized protein LOC115408849 [Salarias fasciatus]XP_029975660.1 uncharacterized protein LOC115408849 [Salarias fasciatus]